LAPRQENIVFDNIHVLYDAKEAFLSIATPVDVLTIENSSFKHDSIQFIHNAVMSEYGQMALNLIACTFDYPGKMDLVRNDVPNKVIGFKTTASVAISDKFLATVHPGRRKILVDSDLPGLRK
jgi:hypothetical protein